MPEGASNNCRCIEPGEGSSRVIEEHHHYHERVACTCDRAAGDAHVLETAIERRVTEVVEFGEWRPEEIDEEDQTEIVSSTDCPECFEDAFDGPGCGGGAALNQRRTDFEVSLVKVHCATCGVDLDAGQLKQSGPWTELPTVPAYSQSPW